MKMNKLTLNFVPRQVTKHKNKTLILAVFDSKKNWVKKTPFKHIICPVQNKIVVELQSRTFENTIIAYFISEIGLEREIKKNFLGIPTQPFGFVNMPVLSFPNYDKLRITKENLISQNGIFVANIFTIL
jgi:uncharacterized protein (DUF2141 family)